MRLTVGRLRVLLREEDKGSDDGDLDYDISPTCKVCPGDGNPDDPSDVVVPNVNDWKSYIRWPVPLCHQSMDFSCGAACVMAMFFYWLPDDYPYEYESDMWDELGTSGDGTEPGDMVRFMNDNGLEAENVTGVEWDELVVMLDDGPVILCFQAWLGRRVADWRTQWDDGHYAILVGIDANNAYMMDPSTHGSYTWLPIKELKHRWHDVDVRSTPKSKFAIRVSGPGEPVQDFPEMLKRLC